MSDLLADRLKQDVSGFELQMTGLLDRKKTLTKEIGQVEDEISSVEPLLTYARNLLNSTKKTAAATAAAAERRRQKQQQAQDPLA